MRSYIIYCDPCGYKRLVTDDVGLKLLPATTVQGRLPVLEKGKVVQSDPVTTMPKFRCPQCGRGITLRKYNIPTKEGNDA